ncbi:hypothetical protein ACFLXT_04235, partial [Chloroflexota bacterium]
FKGGRSGPGARATKSHTASLSGVDEVFDAVCKQAGIIRCNECSHLFEVAQALATQPVPKGKRVAVIGSGGQSVVTADACATLGLELPEFDEDTKRSIKKLIASFAAIQTNPVDSPGGGAVHRLVEILLALDYIDGIIIRGMMERPSSGTLTADEVAEVVADAEGIISVLKKYSKPLIVSSLPAGATHIGIDLLIKASIPIYAIPEEAARAMWGLVRYGEILKTIG